MATTGRWLLMLLTLWRRTGLTIMQAGEVIMTLTEAALLQIHPSDLYGTIVSVPAFLFETTGSLWIPGNLPLICLGKTHIIASRTRAGTWRYRTYSGKRFLNMTLTPW